MCIGSQFASKKDVHRVPDFSRECSELPETAFGGYGVVKGRADIEPGAYLSCLDRY